MRQPLLFILFLMAAKAFAQKDDPIFKLAKKDIIDKAEAIFQQSYPDFRGNSFDRIQLSKSTKGGYLLTFGNSINYIPLGKSYYYSAECLFRLIEKKDSFPEIEFGVKGVSEQPYESSEIQQATAFYIPSPTDKKAIQFVLKALKKNNPSWKSNGQLIITEEKEVYQVHQKDATNSEFYTVAKSNGKISFLQVYDMPTDEVQWEEINW